MFYNQRVRMYLWVCLCLVLLLITSACVIEEPELPTLDENCNCNSNLECVVTGLGNNCRPSLGCSRDSGYTGVCEQIQVPDGPPSIPTVQSPFSGDLFNLAFLAYQAAIENDGGQADPELWGAQLDKAAPNPEEAQIARRVVNAALYITLGDDFQPNFNEGPEKGGEVLAVADPEATLVLFQATHAGVAKAVASGDITVARTSLEGFWKQYPNYAPKSSGFCYGEKTLYDSPLDCQATLIEDLLITWYER